MSCFHQFDIKAMLTFQALLRPCVTNIYLSVSLEQWSIKCFPAVSLLFSLEAPPSGQLYELLLSLRRSREAGLISVSSVSLSHCLCSGSGSVEELPLCRSFKWTSRLHIHTML